MTDQKNLTDPAPLPKLTPRQRAELRSVGQGLKPLLMIGKEGLTDTVLTQLEALIERHELVKIKLLNTLEDDRHDVAAALEAKARASLVQVIGRMILMYRRHPKKPKLLVAAPKETDLEQAKKIWMDGKLVDWNDAKVHILSHSIHYGSGVFEGIRCYDTDKGPAIFRLKDHLRRLYESAHIMMMEIPYTQEELEGAVKETVRANGLGECYIRPLVHRGYGQLGINPMKCPVVVSISVWKWGAYLGEEGLTRGIRARVSSYSRSHVNTLATKAKATGNYLNAVMAKMEAIRDGYDEAVMLDTDGNLSEGTGENLFLVDHGKIKTVAARTILLGITRETVMTLLEDQGQPVREAILTRDQLYSADEAFFTGTAAEVTPIREVDHRKIGKVAPGPVTKDVQARYFDVVHGRVPKYHGWCDWV